MVYQPITRSPSTRGISPMRKVSNSSSISHHNSNNVKKILNTPPPKRQRSLNRSNSLNNGNKRTNSVEKLNNGKNYQGRSPMRSSMSNLTQRNNDKNAPYLVKSRGNEWVDALLSIYSCTFYVIIVVPCNGY